MARLGELDYTSRDYDSTLASLVAAVLADPALAGFDTSPGNPDMLLLRAVATLGDRLSYYENRSVLEAFLATCRLRQSCIDHCAGIDYRLSTATPAVVTVTFTLARAYADSVTFPAGTQIEVEDGSVTYETDADLTIAAYSLTGSVACTEGRTVTTTATGEAALVSPSGQRVVVGEIPWIWDAESVTVGADSWTRVDNFLNSTATSKHYRVELDTDDRATVVFGDGVNGVRPVDGATITITYRVGGGVRGRVRRGTLTRLLGSFVSGGGESVEASATNAGDSSGGDDRETIAHAKLAAPVALRATTRSVAREDYAAHAMEVPGVGRALCHTHAEDPGLPWLMHRVYVVPTSGGTADAALLTAVETYLTTTKPRGGLDALQVVSATYDSFAVVVKVGLEDGAVEADVLTAVEAAVTAFFLPTAYVSAAERYRHEFGGTLRFSELEATIQAVPGVRYVTLSAPATDTPMGGSMVFPALLSVAASVV